MKARSARDTEAEKQYDKLTDAEAREEAERKAQEFVEDIY